MASSEANVSSRATPLGENDPRTLGNYTLLGKLGQGGMGTVYLGRSELGRLVAIKVVRADVADDAQFRSRFRQEAATARRVARRLAQVVRGGTGEAAAVPIMNSSAVNMLVIESGKESLPTRR